MFTQTFAALKSARARAEARRNYQRLLESDDDQLLRDVGVTRNDLRRALRQR